MNICLYYNDVNINDYVINSDLIPIINRNRDWKPNFAGFKFEFSERANIIPQKNDKVEIFVDGVAVYLGFVFDFDYNTENLSNSIQVDHYLQKLNKKTLEYNTLHNLLNYTSNEEWTEFWVNAGTDTITSYSHGIADDGLVRLLFKSTGTLPVGILPNKYYRVRVINEDKFKICDGVENYDVPHYVDITSAGTGSHYYSFGDKSKYNESDGIVDYPIVNLGWLTEKIFSTVDATIDSTDMDDTIIYKTEIGGTDYTFKWREMYVDENMLYCINQSVATNHETLDTGDDYSDNKITLMEFVQELFGMLGITIYYVDTSGGKANYHLNAQTRNNSGFPQPSSEPFFNIADDNKIKFASKKIFSENTGYLISWKWYTDIYYNRYYYRVTAVTNIEEQGKQGQGPYKSSPGWKSNLVILLADKSSSLPYPRYIGGTFGMANYWLIGYAMDNIVSAIIYDFYQEKITCPIDLTIKTIKENFIDISQQTSEITQEKNLLTS